jgi:anti-sigma B factor antagonist
MQHTDHETLVVDLEARAGEVWVLPSGELDIDTIDEVQRALSIALASDAERVVIDLRGLELLDSTGLRVIVGACRGPDGPRVSLVEGPPAVQRMFAVSGLAQELPFRPADPAGPADAR